MTLYLYCIMLLPPHGGSLLLPLVPLEGYDVFVSSQQDLAAFDLAVVTFTTKSHDK